MSMSKTKRRNITWVSVISVVVVSLAFIYWWSCNTKAPVWHAERVVIGLVNLSGTQAHANSSDEIERAEAVKKGTNTNDQIDKEFKDFIEAWKDAADNGGTGMLGKDARGKAVKYLSQEYTIQARKFNSQSYNELAAMIAISFIVLTFLGLALLSNVLRDIKGNPVPLEIEMMNRMAMAKMIREDTPTGEVKRPYSLSRTQLGVWITIISSIYTYAVLWDGREMLDINNTALLLMGIAGGTFAVGAILDTSEVEQKEARHKDRASQGFIKDILSDANGISIHRFQNVVWTVVAILVYFYRYNNPGTNVTGLPELGSTLLALTGISSATYLTLKARENVSLKKSVKINIQLLLPNDLEERKLIEESEEGLRKARVSLINEKGEANLATLMSPDTKFYFVGLVEVARPYRIEAEWQGSGPLAPVKLKGSFATTFIPSVDAEEIQITMKKPV